MLALIIVICAIFATAFVLERSSGIPVSGKLAIIALGSVPMIAAIALGA